MTNRERWVVYPLLFFSLLMGFKSSYLNPISFNSQEIHCKRLHTEQFNGTPAASLTAVSTLATQAAKIASEIQLLKTQVSAVEETAEDSAD